ncbi:MAG: hypothetical protein JSR33_07380 [Proteobacteria bacterium]|nr:hypothetical protein [Pseudomonadota bacterium]
MYRKVKRTPLVFDHKPALIKAIKICDYSQKKLGDWSGLGAPKINYLLNRGQTVKLEDALAIQEVTQKKVKWYELAEPNELNQKLMAKSDLLHNMSISERVELGLVYEAELRSRPAGSVKGRIECEAARHVLFGNYSTYRQAKKVKLQGIPECVAAMDLKKFKIFPLSDVADYPPEQQRYLLSLALRPMKAWMRAHPVKAKTPTHPIPDSPEDEISSAMDTVWVSSKRPAIHPDSHAHVLKMIRAVLEDSALGKAEKNSQLPLRLFFLSLCCHADEQGRCQLVDLEAIGKCLWGNRRDGHTALQYLLKAGKVQLSPLAGESS